jgi:WD40 repeat protein
MVEEAPSVLNIAASIGFNNYQKDSLCIHPSDLHLIWAQGSVLVVKSIGQDNNSYLKGHEGKVTTITCSKNGHLLASGEDRGQGLQACMIVWDFNTHEMLYRVRYHKVNVRALSFSADSMFLVSLGGIADGNQIVCWNMNEGRSEAVMPATD